MEPLGNILNGTDATFMRVNVTDAVLPTGPPENNDGWFSSVANHKFNFIIPCGVLFLSAIFTYARRRCRKRRNQGDPKEVGAEGDPPVNLPTVSGVAYPRQSTVSSSFATMPASYGSSDSDIRLGFTYNTYTHQPGI